MALALLDGTNANIDISFGGVSHKCVYNMWSADLDRQFNEQTTFCSTNWKDETPGMRQLTGQAKGFVSKGSALSDPTASGFTSQTGVAIVLTMDVGCTLTFTGWVGRVHVGVQAALNSEQSVDFRSKGAVTVAWVVS